jgi:hypothetical protein
MDQLALLGTQAVITSIVSFCIGIVVFYLVLRAGIAAGLRDHTKWLEKRAPRGVAPERQSLVPPQPPQQY